MSRKQKNSKPDSSQFDHERSLDIADSLFRTIVTEHKYQPFSNQQLAGAIELMLERLRNPHKPEAWVYLCASIRDSMNYNLERSKAARTANT
jgi:hypothetical protein